jgi:hypothetical protein
VFLNLCWMQAFLKALSSSLCAIVGPSEENEEWTKKFFRVISERLGMASGGLELT